MTKAEIDVVAPPFELPATNGARVALWDFKGRAPVVVFFPHAHCTSCLTYLKSLRRDANLFEEHGAQLLMLVPSSLAECQQLAAATRLSFPVLADAVGKARARYLDDPGHVGLFVLGRYGEPFEQWLAPEADALPPTAAVLSVLNLVEIECPECGVPEWF